jgi:hypothetical protein
MLSNVKAINSHPLLWSHHFMCVNEVAFNYLIFPGYESILNSP